MLMDKGLSPLIQHQWAAAIKRRASFTKGQQQEIDESIGDAESGVRRQFGSFAKGGMHKVMRNSTGASARRKLACRHLRRMKSAFLQQFRWYDHYIVPRQRWADDSVRTGYIIGETIAGH